jgi:regulator of protease activity HflC (stomatin/prohibitin superfamily)
MVAFLWSLDKRQPPPPARTQRKWVRFFEHYLPNISIVLMVLTLFAAVLYPHMLITVPSGHVGVLWKRFSGPGLYCWCILHRGTVLDPSELREEGLHIIWPWDELIIYDLRLQSTTETYNTISSDGVSVLATINIRFQLQHNSVAVLHKFIGPGYSASVVRPEVGSRAREVIAKYTAEQVYSTQRQAIEEKIRESTQQQLGPHLDKLVQPEASEQKDAERYKDALSKSILILDTLVLGIELPAPIVGAINRKTEQFYLVQEYTFRVEREQKESERKQIEANGIQAFQRTVSQGISDSYLRWRGIEATLALSQSTNSKIVVIGSGKDGMPIILGNVDTPPPAAATTPTSVPPTPTEGGAAGKDRAPATSATVTTPPAGTTPPEKKPGADATPEKAPTAGAATPSDKAPTTGASPPSAAKPDEPSSAAPLSLSDIEAFLARLSRTIRSIGSESGTSPAPSPTAPADKPAAAPTR